jgi:glycosyl transferase, family 25
MDALLGQFDRIYIINLATRADRRDEMQAQLRTVGLDLRTAPVQLFTAVRPDGPGEFESIGARGCFMSHLGILQDAERAGWRSILILEDDFDFCKDYARLSSTLARDLVEANWSIFYGGYRLAQALSAQPSPRLQEAEPGWGVGTTHCIALRGAAIAETARYLQAMLGRKNGDPLGGPMHVDGAYSWFRNAHPEHRTLLAVPEIGDQRPSRTDIHDLRWYDRWPGVRDAAHALRKLKRAR